LWRLVTGVLGLAGLIVVAFSELVLGVHYPSDITAGWLLAGAWVAALRAVGLPHGRLGDDPRSPGKSLD
jgi:membrane-associated phospholipid phosphatase